MLSILLQANTSAPSAAAWATACCRQRLPHSLTACSTQQSSLQRRSAVAMRWSTCATCCSLVQTTGRPHLPLPAETCSSDGRRQRRRVALARGLMCRCSWCHASGRRRQALWRWLRMHALQHPSGCRSSTARWNGSSSEVRLGSGCGPRLGWAQQACLVVASTAATLAGQCLPTCAHEQMARPA